MDHFTPNASNQGPKPFSIAIVGGGLGGLALAIGLLRHKVPIQIYEAAQGFSEIGAGVAFGPNALRAIAMIDPGLKSACARCATRNGCEAKRKAWLAVRLACNVPDRNDSSVLQGRVGDLVYQDVAGESGQCSVHRAKFLEELVKLIPDGIAHFGKSVVDIKPKPEGEGVRLTFRDGTTAEASAAIGCDGIKSRVRRILLGEDDPFSQPQYVGEYAFRGLVPMAKAVEILGDFGARNGVIHAGYYGYIVTYPIDHHETMNMVAVREKADGKWEHDEWVVASTREAMLESFAGWPSPLINLLRCVETTEMWALFDHGRASKYFEGRICIMGDAAHASTPHQGQGAGMAFEDAYVLSQLIGHASRDEDLEEAFKAYDTVRRPRTQKLVETSRAAGRIYTLREPGTLDDMVKVKQALQGRHDWIWYEDLEREVAQAKVIMANAS